MPGKFEAPRKNTRSLRLWLLPAAVLMLAAVFLRRGDPEQIPVFTDPAVRQETAQTAAAETAPSVTERAVITVQGDLLMHATFFQEKYDPVCRTGDGSYDFSSLFRHLTGYIGKADYAAVNLETTLGGEDFPYQGNPSFNCPDEILDAVKGAGYDLLLTANNHSYDTLMAGINRTLTQIGNAGLDSLGTRLSGEDPRFLIRDIGGIRVGMVCYTYTMTVSGGKPRLNDNSPVENPEQINYFSYNGLDSFYEQMQSVMAQMRAQGAEATVLFIHWGTEYETVQNSTQEKIAQKMCDLGFDVIVGGHPHVVQPMVLLTSSAAPGHKTVCIYSLGNAVSNQRRELMRLDTGHTEDGAMLTVTLEKYTDGSARLADVEVIPTWVHLFERTDGKNEYNILPLDAAEQDRWMERFGVDREVYAEMVNSYNRTMAIVEPGLNRCRAWLSNGE